MEKQVFPSQFSTDQHPQYEPNKIIPEHIETNNLYKLIPNSIKIKYSQRGPTDSCLYNCLINLHNHNKIEQLKQIFDQINADVNVWADLSNASEKISYIMQALQKNIQQTKKKVNNQANTYINCTLNNKKLQRNSRQIFQKTKANDFDWLNLNTKNQMLKSKLKTKLVQTINQFKNQKKLRQVMGRQLEDHEKIHLEDDQTDLFQDQKSKINYQWTPEDQGMFLDNIKKLKQKFTKTQFLKNCHRYKFITNSELKTLACQQISRKLDKNNKAFLSREFLLDKYFSTNQNLTQKQIKFILKTSPLLGKCVDKAFVRAAIKNIRYEDIDKMQLQIAQQIIQRFQMIRNLVKVSRKTYKQNQNNRAKNRIQVFEKLKKQQQIRANINQKLQTHKVKMIRNLNFRPKSALNHPNSSKNKQNYDSIYENECNTPQKMIWPLPLNNHHPSTGLFIRDCSQQLNDQLNQYQKIYLKSVLTNNNQNESVNKNKNFHTQQAMVKFYTGGPLDNYYTNRTMCLNSTNTFSMLEKRKQNRMDQNYVKTLCQAFKTTQYRKQIIGKLNTLQIDQIQEEEQPMQNKNNLSTSQKFGSQFGTNQFTRRSKKTDQQEFQLNTGKKATDATQKAIKDKIIEGKQKSKMTIYVKKLLSLAAQNSFLSLKALNLKFTPSQINSLDAKGNTALFYATKHKNSDFIEYLLSMKADVNVRCQKGLTPLHNAFKSSNYSLICKCLLGPIAPNLNTLDDQNKTPLAYCCRKILQMLGLQTGVVSVPPNQKIKFDNNALLCINSLNSNGNEQLQLKFEMKRRNMAATM